MLANQQTFYIRLFCAGTRYRQENLTRVMANRGQMAWESNKTLSSVRLDDDDDDDDDDSGHKNKIIICWSRNKEYIWLWLLKGCLRNLRRRTICHTLSVTKEQTVLYIKKKKGKKKTRVIPDAIFEQWRIFKYVY